MVTHGAAPQHKQLAPAVYLGRSSLRLLRRAFRRWAGSLERRMGNNQETSRRLGQSEQILSELRGLSAGYPRVRHDIRSSSEQVRELAHLGSRIKQASLEELLASMTTDAVQWRA